MPLIQIAEWQRKTASLEWDSEAREAISELALGWKTAHGLNAPPLEWGGNDGHTLHSRQWVGIVEWGEFRVEIYPKLDAHLLGDSDGGEIPEIVADSCLRALLSMIEAADYGNWISNERAALEFEPLQFPDVWAYLLGKNLAPELRGGLSHAYIAMQDDLPSVRGKIAVSRQISHHFGRADKIACRWDEWTPDNALNRLFKSALEFLLSRVTHSHAKTALKRCLWLLDEIESVAPREALAQTERFAFGRANQRFRPAFELARRLLASQSPDFGACDAQSWVFLTDMNKLFEAFCARALEAKWGEVFEQREIGSLFVAAPKIAQKPDFLWRENGSWQIGDAKWKLIGQSTPNLEALFADEGQAPPQKLKISPDDVRQLTTYSEIIKRREALERAPDMMILYPCLGGNFASQARETWNGARLRLCPVRVKDFGESNPILP